MKGEYDIDTLSADGAQESPPTRLPASEGTIPPGSDGPFAMTRQPGSTDPVAAHFEGWGVHMCDAEHLAAPGYVLVNAEGLAAALRVVRSDKGNIDPDGRWDLTIDEEAAAILAAIQEQTDE